MLLHVFESLGSSCSLGLLLGLGLLLAFLLCLDKCALQQDIPLILFIAII